MAADTLTSTKTVNKLQLRGVKYDHDSKLITVDYDEGYEDGQGVFVTVTAKSATLGTTIDFPNILSLANLRTALRASGVIQ